MNGQHRRRITIRRRSRKPRKRHLQFEHCEERVMLTTTPVSESLQANINLLQQEVVVANAAANANLSTNNATNAANNDFASGNATTPSEAGNQVVIQALPQAVDDALQSVQPGEGGFERFDFAGVTADGNVLHYERDGHQFADETTNTAAADNSGPQANGIELQTATNFTLSLLNDAIDFFTLDVSGRSTQGKLGGERSGLTTGGVIVGTSSDVDRGSAVERFAESVTLWVGGVIGNHLYGPDPPERADSATNIRIEPTDSVGRTADDHIGSSPPTSKLTIPEITLAEVPSRESELRRGEGEFVRLTVGTHAERIEWHDMPNPDDDVQIAHGPVPPSEVQVDITTTRGDIASRVPSPTREPAAWDIQLTPVRHVALAFDYAEPTTPPVANAHDERAEDAVPESRNETLGGDSVREVVTPSNDTPVLPPPGAVSTSQRQQAEPDGEISQPYVAVSSLLAALAGPILVKDRWQKLQPRDEKQNRRKPG